MQIGFQLYSARNYPLAEVLKNVAAFGYNHVEGYGALYTDPPALKAQLNANGLRMPTAHISLADLEDSAKGLKLAETLGIEVIICPWLAPADRGTSADGWRRVGERLERIARPYLGAGLGFAHHNHDFEFMTCDGRYGMDWLLAAAPSIKAEVDVAWIVRGEADPVAWLEANGPRIVAIHVKDLAKPGQYPGEDGWADAGHGSIDWPHIWKVAREKTAARYFIAEHDNPSDIDRFASRSIAAIKSFGA